MLKRLARSDAVLAGAGKGLAAYLGLVRGSTRFLREPDDYARLVAPHLPVILTAWHGQHLLASILPLRHHEMAGLVSRSADGEINAAFAEAMGMQVIRGSGGRNRLQTVKKGGAQALREMLRALERGVSVAQTADVPRGEPRRCGAGIVTLARLSGRPIVPVAAATRPRITLPTWDRMSVPLPFSRGAFVAGEPIYVPRGADGEACEAARRAVEAALVRAQARADELAAG